MQLSTINLNKLSSIFIFVTFLSLVTMPQSSVRAGNLYIFECQQNSQTGFFATVVKQRPFGKTKEIILWKSKYITHPQATCREVSDRFNKLWTEGNLNWLIISRTERSSGVIVCGFAKKTNSTICDERYKIFTLSGATDPQTAYKNLLGNLKPNSTEPPIFQSSDDEITIDFKASIEQISVTR
jgi:Circadian oscillating protein COP23